MPAAPRPAALVPLAAALLAGPAAAAPPVSSQPELADWWLAAAELRLGDTAYAIKDRALRDGVCGARFVEGVVLPVISGSPPLSDRVVGFIFVGDGELKLGFPNQGDAWHFANHRAVELGEGRDRLQAVADREAPWSARFDRALLLGADPALLQVMDKLEPVGSGAVFSASSGADTIAEIIVTDHKGELKARMVGTNLLADRRRLLEGLGFDLRTVLRQDRLLVDELGVAGKHVRQIADFRTDQEMGVARGVGATVGGEAYDRWLTCLRDGQDRLDTGFVSQALSLGVDSQGRFRSERWSGTPFDPRQAGPRLSPAAADTELALKTVQRGMYEAAKVKSTLTFEAKGGPAQQVTLRLPVSTGTVQDWTLDHIRLADGAEAPWVGLDAMPNGRGQLTALTPGAVGLGAGAAVGGAETAAATLSQSSSGGGAVTGDAGGAATGAAAGIGGGEATSTEALTAAAGADPSMGGMNPNIGTAVNNQLTSAVDNLLWADQPLWVDVFVALPAPVPEGQTTTLTLEWRSRWPSSNYAAPPASTSDGASQVRQLGITTGPRPLLPDVSPAGGAVRWQARTRVGRPDGARSPRGVAVTGTTTREWTDDGGWTWVEAVAQGVEQASVAIGKWTFLSDPPADGMPGVRVFTFPGSPDGELPPELRRMVAWLDRFLPSYTGGELEVYQDRSLLPREVQRGEHLSRDVPGLIGLRTVRVSEVTDGGELRRDEAHLMQETLARQVAREWWGSAIAPATARDAWLADSLSDAFAALYLRSVHGPDDYNKALATLHTDVERPRAGFYTGAAVEPFRRDFALTSPPAPGDPMAPLRRDYGHLVLVDLLRARVGDAAFFSALDGLAAAAATRGRMSTEELQQAFEATSGRDLSDFFGFWVHGGMLPNLRLEYRVAPDGAVHGCLRSDLPYGRFDAPVAITDASGTEGALVPVVDGVGVFTLPPRAGPVRLEIAPPELVVARAREVKTVERTSCEGG